MVATATMGSTADFACRINKVLIDERRGKVCLRVAERHDCPCLLLQPQTWRHGPSVVLLEYRHFLRGE